MIVYCCRVSPGRTCAPCRAEGRSRASVALCDGPASPVSRRKATTCGAPLCGEHRTRVGVDRDLCPRWTANATTTGEVAIATLPDDDAIPLRSEGESPTLLRSLSGRNQRSAPLASSHRGVTASLTERSVSRTAPGAPSSAACFSSTPERRIKPASSTRSTPTHPRWMSSKCGALHAAASSVLLDSSIALTFR